MNLKRNHTLRLRVVAALSLLLAAPAAALAQADESLAKYVPADVGLYVELRQAVDLLTPLTEPQLWLTVSELAGQPARIEESQEWQQRVQQTLNMSPVEVIRRLFAQRVAFTSQSLRHSQDAVILCQPPEPPRTLLRNWKARPLPTAGRTSVYSLPNNVGLAVNGDLLVFGDSGAPGMFRRELRLLEGGDVPSLADDPTYRRLLARVPQNPDGVAFARLYRATSTTSAPAESQPQRPDQSELLGPLRGASNVLLAVHRNGPLLQVSAVGDAPPVATQPARHVVDLLRTLPARTLVAWAGGVDYSRMLQGLDALPERNVLRVALQAQQKSGYVQQFTSALEDTLGVAVGVVTPASRQIAAPPVPAVALLLVAKQPEAVLAEWDQMVQSALAINKLLMLEVGGSQPALTLERMQIVGVPAVRLDLTPLLGDSPQQNPLGELHLCWALDGNVLILASHSDWLEQILVARRGGSPEGSLHGRSLRLDQVLAASLPGDPCRDHALVLQTGPIADLGSEWLQFLERYAPYALYEGWWRMYQPGGRPARLGIQVSADASQRRLRVQSIDIGAPAEGVLRPGDEIIGCNGLRFATSQPVEEVQRGLTERPDARWVDLLVERDGGLPRRYRVPLPFVDPVQVLRRVISVGQLFQRVVYTDELPDPAGPRGWLTLELRLKKEPLFNFATAAPTQPASPLPTPPASPPPTQPVTAAPTHPVAPPPPPPATPPPTQPAVPPSTQPAAQSGTSPSSTSAPTPSAASQPQTGG